MKGNIIMYKILYLMFLALLYVSTGHASAPGQLIQPQLSLTQTQLLFNNTLGTFKDFQDFANHAANAYGYGSSTDKTPPSPKESMDKIEKFFTAMDGLLRSVNPLDHAGFVTKDGKENMHQRSYIQMFANKFKPMGNTNKDYLETFFGNPTHARLTGLFFIMLRKPNDDTKKLKEQMKESETLKNYIEALQKTLQIILPKKDLIIKSH